MKAAAADDVPSSMQSISTSLTLPSGADQSVGHKGGDEETRVPYMEGYLHKRKIVGFRIWKRRYVVLQGRHLPASARHLIPRTKYARLGQQTARTLCS